MVGGRRGRERGGCKLKSSPFSRFLFSAVVLNRDGRREFRRPINRNGAASRAEERQVGSRAAHVFTCGCELLWANIIYSSYDRRRRQIYTTIYLFPIFITVIGRNFKKVEAVISVLCTWKRCTYKFFCNL